MGLAGPRNRRKLDHDPNNTRWTRDETTFGQKILRAQGWQPGKFLGAQDTAHAQLHSAASLAPIKINLKDDTLGLGAKIRQKQSDECTGLDVFKDLLGRLNGKSEEILEKERQVRSEIKTNLVVERKYGPMRFVSGGLLVGDQMMAALADKKPALTPVKDESVSETSQDESGNKAKKEKKDRKSKKRKAGEPEEADTSDTKREKKRKKRSKTDEESKNDDTGVEKSAKRKKDKEKKILNCSEIEPEEEDIGSTESEVKRKKSKKSKNGALPDTPAESSEDAVSEKARKKEKKKKDKKRKQADSTEACSVTETIVSSTTTLTATPQDSGSSTPSNTSALTPHALSARHRARSRHIASKKMAFGDIQALNQIFMIKPV
ncbi:protein PXR1 [Xylaria flabelliformis]|nr:protein PXR1 [Xylaria flabelliformis]